MPHARIHNAFLEWVARADGLRREMSELAALALSLPVAVKPASARQAFGQSRGN